MLKKGDIAPDFDLPESKGNNLKLADFKHKKNIVLYFYPKDDTPGCTVEAKDFRDLKDKFDQLDSVIIGVSKDDSEKHCKFIDKYNLNFYLISDLTGTTLQAYGVWSQKSMFGKKYMGIERATFLIDKEGIIQKTWPKVKVTDHAKEVLEEVKKLNK